MHKTLRIFKVVYLALEICFFLAWFISLIIVQAKLGGIDAAEPTRLAHFLIGMHFVVPSLALGFEIQTQTRQEKKSRRARVTTDENDDLSVMYFLVFFAVFGFDYWSLVESLYSTRIVTGFNDIWYLQRALSGIGVFMTSYWIIWYAIAYIMAYTQRKKLKDDDDDDGDAEENAQTPLYGKLEKGEPRLIAKK